jgi:hypothetical protein
MTPAVLDFLRQSFGKQIVPRHQSVGENLLLFFRRITVLWALAAFCLLVTGSVWLISLSVSTAPWGALIVVCVVLTCTVSALLTVKLFSKRLERFHWQQIELMRLELNIQKARIERESLLYNTICKSNYADQPAYLSELMLRKEELDTLAKRIEEILRYFEALSEKRYKHS